MNASNYPPGSDNSSAPWNQKEPKMEKCHYCAGTGEDEYGEKCEYCNGEGEIEVEEPE